MNYDGEDFLHDVRGAVELLMDLGAMADKIDPAAIGFIARGLRAHADRFGHTLEKPAAKAEG